MPIIFKQYFNLGLVTGLSLSLQLINRPLRSQRLGYTISSNNISNVSLLCANWLGRKHIEREIVRCPHLPYILMPNIHIGFDALFARFPLRVNKGTNVHTLRGHLLTFNVDQASPASQKVANKEVLDQLRKHAKNKTKM
jgi:hypothetical protein